MEIDGLSPHHRLYIRTTPHCDGGAWQAAAGYPPFRIPRNPRVRSHRGSWTPKHQHASAFSGARGRRQRSTDTYGGRMHGIHRVRISRMHGQAGSHKVDLVVNTSTPVMVIPCLNSMVIGCLQSFSLAKPWNLSAFMTIVAGWVGWSRPYCWVSRGWHEKIHQRGWCGRPGRLHFSVTSDVD